MVAAVFSVVYPGVEEYFGECLSSLSEQTDKNFTLFLVDDGLPDLERVIKTVDFNVEVLKLSGPPASLRKKGIQWMIEKDIQEIIFIDSDDYAQRNRVEVSRKMLENYDIVVNELLLFGKDIDIPFELIGGRFKNNQMIKERDIVRGNCMGLSNTSTRVGGITKGMGLIPDRIIAFDWALFAMSIHEGARAIFINDTQTHYRQHLDNTASVRNYSHDQILKGVKVKKEHYHLMSKVDGSYINLAREFDELFNNLNDNETLREKYCDALRHQMDDSNFWWGHVKTLTELNL